MKIYPDVGERGERWLIRTYYFFPLLRDAFYRGFVPLSRLSIFVCWPWVPRGFQSDGVTEVGVQCCLFSSMVIFKAVTLWCLATILLRVCLSLLVRFNSSWPFLLLLSNAVCPCLAYAVMFFFWWFPPWHIKLVLVTDLGSNCLANSALPHVSSKTYESVDCQTFITTDTYC